jgi:hypothetical protein
VGGVLLADEELKTEPLHLTIVGSKHDALAQSLWRAALQVPIGVLNGTMRAKVRCPILTCPTHHFPTQPRLFVAKERVRRPLKIRRF